LEGTADENAAKILDLHKRHAGQICDVIDGAIQNHVKEIREGSLPESCLLILALPEKYRGSGESIRSEKPQYAFRKRGDFWEIIFEDKEVPPLKDEKGMHYIAYLLRHPNREFHVFHLVHAVDGTPPPVDGEIFRHMSEEQWNEEGLTITSLKEEQNKARKAVSNCITASRKKIQQEHPELGRHLSRPILKTGFFCSYTPDKLISWEL
jgi:hypothetical protein